MFNKKTLSLAAIVIALSSTVHAKTNSAIIKNDSTCTIKLNTTESYSGDDITAPTKIEKMSQGIIRSYPKGKLVDVKTLLYTVHCDDTNKTEGEIDITFTLGNIMNIVTFNNHNEARIGICEDDHIISVADAIQEK